ncbi:MAG TPA: organomercurial lyase [Acidimicrobiales bacterium]|nr:organomercurial lyase [Acidimicrobiales bacterium]
MRIEVDLDELAAAVVAACPELDRRGQHLTVEMYRTLAEGAPVSARTLARRCELDEPQVAETLGRWPGVFRDDAGDVVGFWGLALAETAHGYTVVGRQLHAWCAWDTLFITPILGQVAEVRSRCPVTRGPVSLVVGPEGLREAEPATAVVSFLSPRRPWGDDVVTSFCHYVLFFASPEAGATWVDEHPGTFLLSLDQGFELGRRFNGLRLGAALESGTPTP